MSYIVQNPNSQTNPTDVYRVVNYQDWIDYTNGATTMLAVVGRFDNYGEAKLLCDRLNNSEVE